MKWGERPQEVQATSLGSQALVRILSFVLNVMGSHLAHDLIYILQRSLWLLKEFVEGGIIKRGREPGPGERCWRTGGGVSSGRQMDSKPFLM